MKKGYSFECFGEQVGEFQTASRNICSSDHGKAGSWSSWLYKGALLMTFSFLFSFIFIFAFIFFVLTFFYFIQMWQLETLLRGMAKSEEDENHLKKTKTLTRSMIPRRYKTPLSKFIFTTKEFMHENWKRIWVITLWLAINLGLFLWKYYQYKNRGAYQIMGQCLSFAKGAAETLKFNMALILFPVCRRILTKLRLSFLRNFVPFDDNISFHKLFAFAIAIMTFVHVIMHLACDFPRIISCPKEKFMKILGRNFDFKQPTYLDLLKSTAGVTGILMILLMAFAFTLALNSLRRSVIKLPWPLHRLAGFNSFWYVHHLLLLVYVLLVIHGYFLFLAHDWTQKTVRMQFLYWAWFSKTIHHEKTGLLATFFLILLQFNISLLNT